MFAKLGCFAFIAVIMLFAAVSQSFSQSSQSFGKDKWFHEAVIDSDVYFYYGNDYLCRIFTPPKKFDQMDVEAIDANRNGEMFLQELKFKKDGKILENYFILRQPAKGHGPPIKERTENRSDVFAEKCLPHQKTLPDGIKELLKRKYQ